MKTYREWLSFLYEQLPMYQRTGASAIKKDLVNIRSLCRELGDPQERIRTIHVAGTNGKGSVSHILSAIYQSAGLKVGLYTSPHYVDFRERIKKDGKLIAEHEVVTFCNRISHVLDDIRPSFFEITVAMAFDYFATQEVDIAIVETGLGGRLDSTNILTPLLSIITNISFDHQNLLGNTLEDIAREKAGIIKHQVPVLIGEYQADVANVFASTANDNSSDLHYASDWASYACIAKTTRGMDCLLEKQGSADLPKEVHLGLHGDYQVANMCTALAGVSILSASGAVEMDLRSIERGLAQVQQLSNMLGRWQVLQENPMIVVDSGHNEAGFGTAMEMLKFARFKKLRMVIGFVKDKDVSKMLAQVPGYASFYWCAAALPRALASEELLEQARKFDLNGRAFYSVESALMQAKQEASEDDFIFVGGSTFVVAEALSTFHQ